MLHTIPKGQAWCGEAVGILVLDESIPRVLGSVLNAETFTFPVRYKKVLGASVNQLLFEKDSTLAKLFIDAAIALQSEGVSAIAGSCGFMALFQKVIADSVSIPVAMSSLVQLHMIMNIVGADKKIGIITASKQCLNEQVFRAIGIGDEEISARLSIVGLDDAPEARGALIEETRSLDDNIMRQEVLDAAQELLATTPNLGAILLECSELPPYALDVQRITHLPVFDFVTMIQYCYMGVRTHSWRYKLSL